MARDRKGQTEKRAVIYARISDDPTSEKAGVQRQTADCLEFCEARGWQVVETLVDNDISASSYSRKPRPAYLRALELAESGAVDAIVAWHVDRLYRQPKELEQLIDLANSSGLVLATCYGEFDLSDADQRAWARIATTFAAKESDDKSRRTKRKHLELAKQGKLPNGGFRAFGYERDGYHVNRKEARLVREAAKRVLGGESLRSIAADWNNRGVPTVRGVAWSRQTLRRMLMSGRLSAQREHQGVVTKGDWPPILTVEQTVRLRAVLSDPARDTVGGVRSRRYLLAGLVYCGNCGAVMSTKRTGRGVSRYACVTDRGKGCGRVGISADRLEADVVEAVLHELQNVKPGQTSDSEDPAFDELARIAARRAELTEAFAVGDIGRDMLTAGERALRIREAAVQAELRQARSRIIAADTVGEAWDKVGFDRQRQVLASSIERIDVSHLPRNTRPFYDPDRWHIIWR